MRTRIVLTLAAAAAIALPGPSAATEPAFDAPMVSGYYGRGADTNVYGAEYVWRPSCECEFFKRYGLDPRWGVNVSYWDGQQPDNAYPSLWDFGGHGYLRYFWHPVAPVEPFVEVGLGIHILSEDRINNNREFGTWFQFGSRIGGGIAFDAGRRMELFAYIEHISNASITSPNDGITIKGIQLRVALP